MIRNLRTIVKVLKLRQTVTNVCFSLVVSTPIICSAAAVRGLARLSKAARNGGRTVIGHDLPALDVLAVEPSQSTAHKTNGRGLLLVRDHLDVGHARGVINGHVGWTRS